MSTDPLVCVGVVEVVITAVKAIGVGSEIVIEELALHPLIESEAVQVYVPAAKPLTEAVVPTTEAVSYTHLTLPTILLV